MRFILSICVLLITATEVAKAQTTLVVPHGIEMGAGNVLFPQIANGNNAQIDPTRDYIAVARSFPQATNSNGITADMLVTNYGYLPISAILQPGAATYSIQGANYNSVSSAFAAVDTALNGIKNQIASYETQMSRGFAAAAALPSIMTPSAPGKTTVSVNAGFFRGETGLGLAIAHRLQTAIPIVASASFAGSGSSVLGRVGAAIEF
jgi:autotransporter adhesin